MESRAILMDTSFNDGSITVVAKMQLDAKVVLCVFCTTEAISAYASLVYLLGFTSFSWTMCVHGLFLGRVGKRKMTMTWFSLSNNWFLALSTALWRSLFLLLNYMSSDRDVGDLVLHQSLLAVDHRQITEPLGLSYVLNTRAPHPALQRRAQSLWLLETLSHFKSDDCSMILSPFSFLPLSLFFVFPSYSVIQ